MLRIPLSLPLPLPLLLAPGSALGQATPETVLVLFAENPKGISFSVDGTPAAATHGTVHRVPVAPGSHEVVVWKGGKEVGRLAVDVPEHHERRCKWTDTVDCYKLVDLSVTEQAVKAPAPTGGGGDAVLMMNMGMMGVGGGGGHHGHLPGPRHHGGFASVSSVPVMVVIPGSSGAVQPGEVDVTVRALDGTDVDLLVGGAIVAELRGAEVTLRLPAGPQRIGFVTPGEGAPYAEGTLDAAGRGAVTLVLEGRAPPRAEAGVAWVVEPVTPGPG